MMGGKPPGSPVSAVDLPTKPIPVMPLAPILPKAAPPVGIPKQAQKDVAPGTTAPADMPTQPTQVTLEVDGQRLGQVMINQMNSRKVDGLIRTPVKGS